MESEPGEARARVGGKHDEAIVIAHSQTRTCWHQRALMASDTWHFQPGRQCAGASLPSAPSRPSPRPLQHEWHLHAETLANFAAVGPCFPPLCALHRDLHRYNAGSDSLSRRRRWLPDLPFRQLWRQGPEVSYTSRSDAESHSAWQGDLADDRTDARHTASTAGSEIDYHLTDHQEPKRRPFVHHHG